MDTDLEQQLRLVEQELSQVQGLFFFFFFGFYSRTFFSSGRIDKTSPLLHFHTCRTMLLLLLLVLGRNLSALVQLNVYTSRIY
jgi:hypothetical protein